MATRDLDAVFYVANAPRVEFHDGMFHISYSIGRNAVFEIVMPPRVFLKTRLLGAELVSKWRLGELPDETNVRHIGKR